jgi:hypothetical protein
LASHLPIEREALSRLRGSASRHFNDLGRHFYGLGLSAALPAAPGVAHNRPIAIHPPAFSAIGFATNPFAGQSIKFAGRDRPQERD